MGCASSTPMIQTTGSEMLKAATHVATDATKTAEDAVEGIKDSVGETLETAKDSVATKVDGVKHEAENIFKEKSEMLEDAANSLMEKLRLKQADEEKNVNENSENIVQTETDAMKTQLNKISKQSTDDMTDELLAGSSKGKQEPAVTGTDTETDSLKTSTPEPEIEQAFAKSQHSQEDDNDNPPTPKPTIAELETLTAEFLKEQQHHQTQQPAGTTTNVVSDMTTMSNEPVIPVKHEHIKAPDDTHSPVSLTADNTTTTTTTALANNDSNTTNVQNPAAVNTEHFQAVSTLTSTMAATTAAEHQLKVAKDKGKPRKSKNHSREQQVSRTTEEKRPRTTEWEKFADMLAQMRKFNPHDALRRGGAYTKFGGAGGIGYLRERPLVLGHHGRINGEDDCSDIISNPRGSPQNSQHCSARASDRVQNLPNRPTTGNNRRNAGGHYAHRTRRSSNGRKFDYNPSRSRVHEFVSSTPFMQNSLLQNTADTQMPYALYSTSFEGIISPPNMRSHHCRSDMVALDLQERARSRSQPSQTHQHAINSSYVVDQNGNSVSLANDFRDVPIFTRQSSIISLSTNSSEDLIIKLIKSSNLDVKPRTTKLPTVKNTSSFLATPRSPFSLRKSYTDLYFSTTSYKENNPKAVSDKSPFRKRKTFH